MPGKYTWSLMMAMSPTEKVGFTAPAAFVTIITRHPSAAKTRAKMDTCGRMRQGGATLGRQARAYLGRTVALIVMEAAACRHDPLAFERAKHELTKVAVHW